MKEHYKVRLIIDLSVTVLRYDEHITKSTYENFSQAYSTFMLVRPTPIFGYNT